MHLTSALTVLGVLAGHALGRLNCTVAAPTLSKRLCESNSCAVYQTVIRGENLHAACRADCDSDNEPWIKLYDGTYVLATKETISGCRSFCQPYSVLGLPRCREAHPSCGHFSLKTRSPVVPIPVREPEPLPLPAIAIKCGIPLPAEDAAGSHLRRRSLSIGIRRYSNTTGTLYHRAVNGTNTTDTVNIPAGIFPPDLTKRGLLLNSTTIGARRIHANVTAAGGWATVLKRNEGGRLNSTLVAGASYVNYTEEAGKGNAGGGDAVNGRSVEELVFRNGSWNGEGRAGRRSPVVKKKLRFWG